MGKELQAAGTAGGEALRQPQGERLAWLSGEEGVTQETALERQEELHLTQAWWGTHWTALESVPRTTIGQSC